MELCINQDKLHTIDILNDESIDFENLLLSDSLLHGLHDIGFQRPSPIQLKAIPIGKCGFDLIVQSKNGTGKTCVFSVIALESIDIEAKCIQVLILAPTREIASQINCVLIEFSKYMSNICCQLFIGGTSLTDDAKRLKNCHIAIATPGRFEHFLKEGIVDYSSIRLLILDEADKLLEKEFEDAINWIYSSLPVSKQIIACSATMPEWLASSLQNYMHQPVIVRLNSHHPDLIGIVQYIKVVQTLPNENIFKAKCRVLLSILPLINFTQCIIYSSNQIRGEDISNVLLKSGWTVALIGAGQDQESRLQAIARLKSNECNILVSTDLTSRGLDVPNVDLVINVDLPMTFDTYLHRIGRAGRFGRYGASVTLVAEGNEQFKMQRITKLCHSKLIELPDIIPADLTKQAFYKYQATISTLNNGHELKNVCEDSYTYIESSNDKIISCNKCESNLPSFLNNDLITNNLNKNISNDTDDMLPKSVIVNSSCKNTINIESLENEVLRNFSQSINSENLPMDNQFNFTKELEYSDLNIDETFKKYCNNINLSLLDSNLTPQDFRKCDEYFKNEIKVKSNNDISLNYEENNIQDDNTLYKKVNLLNKNKIDEIKINDEENKENIINSTLISNLISENNLTKFNTNIIEILPEDANSYNKVSKNISQCNASNQCILKYSKSELYEIGKNLKNIKINNRIKKVVSNLRIIKNSQIINSKQISLKKKFDTNKASRNNSLQNNIDVEILQQSSKLLNLNNKDDSNFLEKNNFPDLQIKSDINLNNSDYSLDRDSKTFLHLNKELPNNPTCNGIYSDNSVNFIRDITLTNCNESKDLNNTNLLTEKLNFNIKCFPDIDKSKVDKIMDESSIFIDDTNRHIHKNVDEFSKYKNTNESDNVELECPEIANFKSEKTNNYKISKNNLLKTKYDVKKDISEDFSFFTIGRPDIESELNCNLDNDFKIDSTKLTSSKKLKKNRDGNLSSKYINKIKVERKQKKENSTERNKDKSKNYNKRDSFNISQNIPKIDNATAFFFWSQYQYHLNMAQHYKHQYEFLINQQKNYFIFNNCIDYIRSMSDIKDT